MTLKDLKRWASQGFPVRVDGQIMFVQADSVCFSGESTRTDVGVALRSFGTSSFPPVGMNARGFKRVSMASVEILTGKEADQAAVKEKLS